MSMESDVLDAVVDDWGTRDGLSQHAELAAHWDGQPGPERPVPGCGCPRCAAYAAGGTAEDAFHAEELVTHLAALPPNRRPEALEAAHSERTRLGLDPAPSVVREGVLLELARRAPGALRRPAGGAEEQEGAGEDCRDPLPVEEARRVPLEEIARRLGLGEPEGRWGEPRVLCPLHDDHDPSLHLDLATGRWFCFPCGIGGDGIDLVQEALGLEFAEAVRWIADGGYSAPNHDLAQRDLNQRTE